MYINFMSVSASVYVYLLGGAVLFPCVWLLFLDGWASGYFRGWIRRQTLAARVSEV